MADYRDAALLVLVLVPLACGGGSGAPLQDLADQTRACLAEAGLDVEDSSIELAGEQGVEITPGLSVVRRRDAGTEGIVVQFHSDEETAVNVERKGRIVAGGPGAPSAQKWADHRGRIVYWSVTPTTQETRKIVERCAEKALS